MNIEEFGDIINGNKTYDGIASVLTNKPVIIGWTDGKGTHHDILFAYNIFNHGELQGGLKSDYLFVSIMRIGAFAFRIYDCDIGSDYVGEKLFISGETKEALTTLINGVREKLYIKEDPRKEEN